MVNLNIAREYLIERGFDPSFIAGLTDELVILLYLGQINKEEK